MGCCCSHPRDAVVNEDRAIENPAHFQALALAMDQAPRQTLVPIGVPAYVYDEDNVPFGIPVNENLGGSR